MCKNLQSAVLKEKETLSFSVIVLSRVKQLLWYKNHACTTTVSEIRQAPTVGQAHRMFLHAQNSAQKFQWKIFNTLDQQTGVEFLRIYL